MAVWSRCSVWRVPVLWILDQVQYDGPCHHASALWIPAYAGMTVRPRPLPLWIDESLVTLFQRVRLQRRRTLFFIILVPMNGRIKSAMTWWSCLSVACVASSYSAWRVPALWILDQVWNEWSGCWLSHWFHMFWCFV